MSEDLDRLELRALARATRLGTILVEPCVVHKCHNPQIDGLKLCESHKDWQICPVCVNWRILDRHHCTHCFGRSWSPPSIARANAGIRIPRYEKQIEGVTVFGGEGEGTNDELP